MLTKEEFRHIFDQHGQSIRNYVYYRSGNTAVADDITQETFIKIWEKNFLYEPQKIKALLYKIAGGLFLDYVRHQKTESKYAEELKFTMKQGVEKTEDNELLRKKCEAMLKVLTEKERTVFLMNRKDEFTYKEIATALNISVKAVEKRMSTALKKLKTISK